MSSPKKTCSQLTSAGDPTQNQIEELFVANFRNHSVYQDQRCSVNSAIFAAKIGEIFDAHSLNAILFTTVAWASDTRSRNGFFTQQARAMFSKGASADDGHFKYHMVLESDGVIYDFDFTNQPVPLNFDKYINEMFSARTLIASQEHELIAYVFPVKELLEPRLTTIGSHSFFEKIFSIYQPHPVRSLKLEKQ